MKSKKWYGMGIIVLIALAAGGMPANSAAGIVVTHRARALQPGEVVVLTLNSPTPLKSASGMVFGKTFTFYSGGNSRVWQGLVGIDLETKAGRYSVVVRATSSAGAPFKVAHVLEIKDKKFSTRRLTMDEKYVTPPKEVEDRIRRESERLEKIFGTASSRKLWAGAFLLPVPGPPNSSFGRRNILNGKARSPHAGTDFTADAGTPIAAPNSGKVVLEANLYFSGNTLILDHGLGLYSFFAHLSQFSVRDGDEVRAGQIVGKVGATGRVTGPHLHWSVRLIDARVDPLSLVAALSPK